MVVRLGVLGGTFDPIHDVHLVLAEEVRKRLRLSEVVFIPAGHPWLKLDHPVTAVEHRVEMVRRAIEGRPYFRLSTIEIERPGPTYTVDTLAELRSQLDEQDEIYFILGCDSLTELPPWHEPSRIIQLCRLVAAPRPGHVPDLNALERAIPGISKRVTILDKPVVDVSSSDIRRRVAGGLPINDLVPPAVVRYIQAHGLYSGQK
ncbi:MAG: nicotinate-nucleotide adenylyltransferase [Dehalococcoidales bacterium]|nr:nicotinate-nucleotide adenylyltransferase [Dehalococcoidales bacterium]